MKFIEKCNNKFGFVVTLDGAFVHAEKTKYNDVTIFDNKLFGRVLMLNESIQLTTYDEAIYHQSMTSHYQPSKDSNILVIGGGDGGIARELRKKEFNSITIVEIDERISILSKAFFPTIWNNVDKDQKCNFIYTDAIEFVKQQTFYDHCVIDLTDPDENSRDLYTKEFFNAIKTNNLTIQLGTPGMQDVDLIIKMLEDCLYDVERETICVPSFFGGPLVIAHCKNKCYNGAFV